MCAECDDTGEVLCGGCGGAGIFESDEEADICEECDGEGYHECPYCASESPQE